MNKKIVAAGIALAGGALAIANVTPAQAIVAGIYNSRDSKHSIRVYWNASNCTGSVTAMAAGGAGEGTVRSVKVDYPYRYKYSKDGQSGPAVWSPIKSPGCWKNPAFDSAYSIVFQTYN